MLNYHLGDMDLLESQKLKHRMECRRAREEAVERSLETWERMVLPDLKKAIKDTQVRKLWWGGIPPKLRPQLWQWAVGNALALSKGMRLRFSLEINF